jgi:hypothetical protein
VFIVFFMFFREDWLECDIVEECSNFVCVWSAPFEIRGRPALVMVVFASVACYGSLVLCRNWQTFSLRSLKSDDSAPTRDIISRLASLIS